MLCYFLSVSFLFFTSSIPSYFPSFPLFSPCCNVPVLAISVRWWVRLYTAALLRLGNACLTVLDSAVTWSESRKVIAVTVCKIVAQNDDETLDLVTYEKRTPKTEAPEQWWLFCWNKTDEKVRDKPSDFVDRFEPSNTALDDWMINIAVWSLTFATACWSQCNLTRQKVTIA